MGFFSSPIKTFDDLFLHTLRDIYYAENKIKNALPTMIDKANDSQLKANFQTHLRETETQIERLKQVFAALGEEAKGEKCPAIEGIIDEANELISDVDDKEVLDAALIAAGQAVEHYEITRYGTLIAWATQLGHEQVIPLLQQTLDEEKATDRKLTELAEKRINRMAA